MSYNILYHDKYLAANFMPLKPIALFIIYVLSCFTFIPNFLNTQYIYIFIATPHRKTNLATDRLLITFFTLFIFQDCLQKLLAGVQFNFSIHISFFFLCVVRVNPLTHRVGRNNLIPLKERMWSTEIDRDNLKKHIFLLELRVLFAPEGGSCFEKNYSLCQLIV